MKQGISLSDGVLKADINGEGLITGLFPFSEKENIAWREGFGGIGYTLRGDKVETERAFSPFFRRSCAYDRVRVEDGFAVCESDSCGAVTRYSVKNGEVYIDSYTNKPEIAMFALSLDFNFLGKKNGTCKGQLLPSSPYTSDNGEIMYCIMPVIDRGFLVCSSLLPGATWQIDYSPYSYGHFIEGFKVIASPPEIYGEREAKHVSVKLSFCKTVFECYEKISETFSVPLILPSVTGSFSQELSVRVLGKWDKAEISLGDKKTVVKGDTDTMKIPRLGYGRHRITPFLSGKAGLDCEVWFGEDIDRLFKKSCAAQREPYHGDDNLCEGMMWCYSLICYMNRTGDRSFLPKVRDSLKTVMCEDGRAPVKRLSIVPYSVDGAPPYHIYKSQRVQEQLSGASMLLEMYKLCGEEKYLDFAVRAAKCIVERYQNGDGAIFAENDYTTVCAPVITFVDIAVFFKERDGAAYRYFASAAKKATEHLLRRGFHFPTEGLENDITDEEMEEGSVSCTALSLLYYCRFIEKKQEYIDFAKEILRFHDNWICYTPDVKMYRSTTLC